MNQLDIELRMQIGPLTKLVGLPLAQIYNVSFTQPYFYKHADDVVINIMLIFIKTMNIVVYYENKHSIDDNLVLVFSLTEFV